MLMMQGKMHLSTNEPQEANNYCHEDFDPENEIIILRMLQNNLVVCDFLKFDWCKM